MSAAGDRAEVFALLADTGPHTTEEVRRGMAVDGTWWHYGRAWNALHGLEQRHWIAAAGAGSGQPVLWFLPAAAEVPA